MKYGILSFLLTIFATIAYSQAGTLTVTNVESKVGSGLTEIEYTFTGIVQEYDISVEVSFDGGDNYITIPATDLTGDLSNVAPGIHLLTWDGNAQFPDTYSETTIIRINATPILYTLTLSAEPATGGLPDGDGEYQENQEIPIETSTNDGYGFISWTGDTDGLDNADATETTLTMPAQDVTLTADFELITYNITYHPDDGENHEDNPVDFTVYDLPIILEDPSRAGYTFEGWFDNAEFTGDEVTEIAETGDVELWAKFYIITYTITYNLDGGDNDAGNPAEFTIEDLPINIEDAAKEAYIFEGWFTNDGFSGNAVTQITETGDVELWAEFETDYCFGVSAPNGFGIVSSSGNCWLDRNLGADRVAQSSTDEQAYGDLYQWGRLTDGHQNRNSGTRSEQSAEDVPGHGDFILTPLSEDIKDWRLPQNNDLWQGEDGTNNPCPDGFRLPTKTEIAAELNSWDSGNAAGAFGSRLKLPASGSRNSTDGDLSGEGNSGTLWSSTIKTLYGYHHLSTVLYYNGNNAFTSSSNRAGGASVRCVYDN